MELNRYFPGRVQSTVDFPDLLQIACNGEMFCVTFVGGGVRKRDERHTYLAAFKHTLMLYYLLLIYRENINLELFAQTPDPCL